MAFYAVLLMTGSNFFSHGTPDFSLTFLQLQQHFCTAIISTLAVVNNVSRMMPERATVSARAAFSWLRLRPLSNAVMLLLLADGMAVARGVCYLAGESEENRRALAHLSSRFGFPASESRLGGNRIQRFHRIQQDSRRKIAATAQILRVALLSRERPFSPDRSFWRNFCQMNSDTQMEPTWGY